jgi:hypothetical protein
MPQLDKNKFFVALYNKGGKMAKKYNPKKRHEQYVAHQEEIKKARREYYKTHIIEENEKSREYYKKNKKKLQKKHREYMRKIRRARKITLLCQRDTKKKKTPLIRVKLTRKG